MTIERCSCGAFIVTLFHKRAIAWRAEHHHEMPEEPEIPTINESGSSHERQLEPDYEQARARTQRIGFHAA